VGKEYDIDLETNDYREPFKDTPLYDYHHKLWELRFGYQEDKTKSFEDNFNDCIKYNHRKSLIKKILDIKTQYYLETGNII
jgi:hypothetical protein